MDFVGKVYEWDHVVVGATDDGIDIWYTLTLLDTDISLQVANGFHYMLKMMPVMPQNVQMRGTCIICLCINI